MVRSNYAAFRQGPAGPDHQKALPAGPQCSTQRAGFVPPQAEGDWLRGAAIDGLIGVASLFACSVGGVPLTRAMNPWATPAASTKRPTIFPCELIPFSDVKADPG